MDHFEILNREDEAQRKIDKSAILRLIGTLLRPHWQRFTLGFALIVVNRACALALPASTRFLVDQVIIKHRLALLPVLILALGVAIAIQAASFLGVITIFAKGGHSIVANLRTRTQDHVQRLHLSFFRHHRSGEIITQIIHHLEDLRKLVGISMIDFASSAATAALSFLVLWHLNVELTIFSAFVFASFISALFLIFSKIHPTYRRRNRAMGWAAGRLGEALSGIATIKGYAAEENEAQLFRKAAHRIRDLNFRIATLEGWMAFSSGIVGSVVGLWVIYRGTHMVLDGALSLGTYLTYSIFLAYLAAPITTVVNLGTQLSEFLVSLTRTSSLLENPREEDDVKRSRSIDTVVGDVQFDHVGFHYEDGRDVLHDITFSVRPGEVVALVGPSGSGKTTIANLLCAFEAPIAGRIMVDGVDLAELVLKDYRKHLGVVFQDSFLFQGTLYENIALAQLEASPEEVYRVCRIARVADFAELMPHGYETLVGERGVKLSGGQRQRVAIARALLSNPKILILDEATASLDSESEHLIQQGLELLMEGRTTLVIAHRLSTIKNADQILVLEAGRIIERGSHEELLKKGGNYRKMWERQQMIPEIFS